MTAVYDGRLIVSDKKLEPCCAVMNALIVLGAVRYGTFRKESVVYLMISDGKYIMKYCPFCGAEAKQ